MNMPQADILMKQLEHFTRRFPTEREGIIIRKGLSPWSAVKRCDLCASDKKYMLKHGITTESIHQYGRWMLHPYCHTQSMQDGLGTTSFTALDYRPLMALPAPARIGIMKTPVVRTVSRCD